MQLSLPAFAHLATSPVATLSIMAIRGHHTVAMTSITRVAELARSYMAARAATRTAGTGRPPKVMKFAAFPQRLVTMAAQARTEQCAGVVI